ncbi:B12-binding domain-containing radical SAM protein [Brucella pseudogrignonensis]|uniref:B12-binding domain-containing radical SAM protein n=1 Tax=Brucella pseudogrignonensis TaxID=419475 RepID=UPI001E2E8911|nr:radical SAM protein [Brucella pseudogrignonensis]MCD4512153.1 B12-binding domain-containing radical SAM protein [Brucella pseudogrignonensis]
MFAAGEIVIAALEIEIERSNGPRGPLRILLINPAYVSLTSRGVGHQIPFGLLCIGGPLIDAGYEVALLDAERHRLTPEQIEQRITTFQPDIVMTGHAGSTPAHPACIKALRAAKKVAPAVKTVYGGVYPTYHAKDILAEADDVDIIVRGEGESVALDLADCLSRGGELSRVQGITFRTLDGALHDNSPAPLIRKLDDWRVGWELIEDWDLYQCFGLGRAAIIQFSRGCPHQCSYCGQYQFWSKWRWRDPKAVAAEIAWLHRTHGVNFVDLADENPTSSKRLWREFLEALVDENVLVRLFATIRATDIVRDIDLLPLMKRAGMICVLMGIETTDPVTLAAIRKGSTVREDQQAVASLREHGILSMLGHIVGFEEERMGDYVRAIRQVSLYDPDLLNAMYVTPHRWSDWTAGNAGRIVIQPDRAKWDYRNQLLSSRYLSSRAIFWMVKLMELAVHARPRALRRVLFHRDPALRAHLRWCFRFSFRVWRAEVAEFLRNPPNDQSTLTLAQWFGRKTTGEAACNGDAHTVTNLPQNRTAL